MASSDKPRLMDQVRRALRVKHYSIRTEKSYCYWIRFYIRFSGTRHPLDMGARDARAFLEHLAVDGCVAAATQNKALNAIVFLYSNVLERPLGDIGAVTRARRSRRLPVVLAHAEVMAVLEQLAGDMRLMASLMYGSGLRVTEVCRLRVRDIDSARVAITVRSGKGDKDRVTLLPASLQATLDERVGRIRRRLQGTPEPRRIAVTLPYALARKYPSAVQKAVKAAMRNAGLVRPGSCHTLRHSFATTLLAGGTDIRTVQELMGHRSVETTQIYTHVLGDQFAGVRSPLG